MTIHVEKMLSISFNKLQYLLDFIDMTIKQKVEIELHVYFE